MSKQTGEQCRQRPVRGGTVCRFHGGKAPQVQAAAEQRQQEAAAGQELAKLWVGLEQARAVTDPVDSMARLAGALEQFLDVVGAKVNALQNLEAGTSLSQLRGEVVLWERTAAMLGRLLDAMARLGIAERAIELEQARVEVVVAAFVAGLGELDLVPSDADRALRAFLVGIGVSPDAVVAGEVTS